MLLKVFVYILTFCYTMAEQENESQIEAAVHKTLVSVARGCMTSVNGTEADLETLHQDPPYPEKSSCILKCLLEKVGVVSNNKYSKIGFMTAVMPMVVRNTRKLAHMKTVSENCDNEVNHERENPCLLGNDVVICIFKYAPELQFNKKVH